MAKNMSFLVGDELPADCLLEIFSYLSLADIIQVKNVCRTWYQVSQHWFKQLQTLVFTVEDEGFCYWELHNHFKHEICTGSNDKKLISLLHLYGHHVKYYKINNYMEINERASERNKLMFKLVPELCKNIVDLNILGYDSYQPSAFKVMATNWRKLEKLFINYSSSTVGKDVSKLIRNNKQLKTLSVIFPYYSESSVNDKFFTYLPATIEEINISFHSMNDLHHAELTHFISASKNFTSLRSLKFYNLDYLSDAAMVAIADFKSLTELVLYYVERYESCKTIDPIASMKCLKSLNLSYNLDLNEDSLINIIESCTHLEQLDIRRKNWLTDKSMAAIAKLDELKILRINTEHVSIGSISSCGSLEVFSCDYSKITGSNAIKLLKEAENLKLVDFGGEHGLPKDFVRKAKKIAKERKKNILCITGCFGWFDSEEMDTPYFKYFTKFSDVTLELFPNYIKNYIKLIQLEDIMIGI